MMLKESGGTDKGSMAVALESEREMRLKLEKLLEVQTVQVDLHKEVRMKTESLLLVEQQSTSRLRQQLDQLRLDVATQERFAQAQDRIKISCQMSLIWLFSSRIYTLYMWIEF